MNSHARRKLCISFWDADKEKIRGKISCFQSFNDAHRNTLHLKFLLLLLIKIWLMDWLWILKTNCCRLVLSHKPSACPPLHSSIFTLVFLFASCLHRPSSANVLPMLSCPSRKKTQHSFLVSLAHTSTFVGAHLPAPYSQYRSQLLQSWRLLSDLICPPPSPANEDGLTALI